MEKDKKQSAGKKLQEKICSGQKNATLLLSDEKLNKIDKFCVGYKEFLDCGKTEREAVAKAVKLAKDNGFVEFEYGKK